MPQYLAILASALPSEASALEASISALKSCISALESSIKALEDSSGPWELLAIVSSLVVVPGIVGELIVIVSEDRDDLHDWQRGVAFWKWRVVLPSDRAPRWRFWFDIIATVVVLVGIMGEAWGSLKLASINSQLRTKTSELRADTDQLLALITLEAGDADTSAKNAAIEAGNAQDSADAARNAANALEARLAWRHIDSKRRGGFIAKLRPYAGTQVLYDFYETTEDPEAEQFLSEIVSLFSEGAHWDIRRKGGGPSRTFGLTCTTSGTSPAERALESVFGKLPSAKTPCKSGPVPAGFVAILAINPKPPP